MQTITINLINPKAKKLINDLVDLGIISIENKTDSSIKWYENKELLHELEEDILQYEQGKLKTFSKEEVLAEISKRSSKRVKEKLVK